MAAARDHLETATREYRTELDRVEFAGTAPRFDEAPVETAIEEAREALDAAAKAAAPDQEEALAALQTYADFLAGIVEMMDALVTSLEQRNRAITFEDNERYERAVDALEDAESALGTARSRFEEARAAFERARERIADPDAVALADAESSLSLLDDLFPGLETIYEGDVKLERGLLEFDTGLADFRSGDYGLAKSAFSQAEAQFLRAGTVYEDGESNAPSELLDLVLRRQCQSTNFATAAEQMTRASSLAPASPRKAREHVRNAEAALSRSC